MQMGHLRKNRCFTPQKAQHVVIFRYFGNILVNIITIKRNHLTTDKKSGMIGLTNRQ